ncbi:MAG: aldehyde dehydrogenase [Chitinophagaceae bacterium]|nr:aldehyde dehydrogenase [Chitinophagaceae bacterium]
MSHISQLEAMRLFFESGKTFSYAFRTEQLKKLKTAIVKKEEQLNAALYADLKKCPEEVWVTETGMVLSELNFMVHNLRKWMKPQRVKTNLANLPSSSYVYKEPLGVVLIIGPWNYPFQLLLNPLLGAIAAGNCVVLKPSEFAPATSAIMKTIITETFSPDYISFVEGEGATVVPEMMNNFSFDHVFYTGSTAVGKIIYKMAAERLIPVTLELGGKSPCIIEDDANMKIAARRIAITKFSNAGQMCVAPDYILVHSSRKQELINALKEVTQQFYGQHPAEAYGYCKMINQKQFERVIAYFGNGKIEFGGGYDTEQLFIEPTVLTGVAMNTPVMKDEIFGPVLPVLSFTDMEEAKKIIGQNPNPLAFYVFTQSKAKEKEWLNSVAFGGGCVNNASWHLTNHHLPFGGRGYSGSGCYHGKYSFETFSHSKAVMKTPTWFDPSIKYPPLRGKLKLFKWVIR